MFKKAVFIFLVLSGSLFSEELTKIAVVDMGRIVDAYFQDATGIKEITILQEKYEEGKNKFISQLTDIQESILMARADGDKKLEKKLAAEKLSIENSLKEFHSTSNTKIRNIKMANQATNEFEKRLQSVIQSVAIQLGFSIVLEDDSSILWYDREDVDITDKVIQALAN